MSECPYCGQRYVRKSGMFRHAMIEHRQAVLVHWIDEYGVNPPVSGQQQLTEAAA